ncbi:unnamed protein product [Clonostachys rosea]|uniref:RNase H type-1 domain-containing protein n=1 Tax=Bionectria ochroleuca TaxID=29856 RepID=A0ABY6UPV9_BIOOC|nr:unnamed protein product [Clonostachys rosea]
MSIIGDSFMSQAHDGGHDYSHLPPGRDEGILRIMHNSRIICRLHGLSVCVACGIGFSWQDELLPCDCNCENGLDARWPPDAMELLADGGLSVEVLNEFHASTAVAPAVSLPPRGRQAQATMSDNDAESSSLRDEADVDMGSTSPAVPITPLEKRSGTGKAFPTRYEGGDPYGLIERDLGDGRFSYIENRTILITVFGSGPRKGSQAGGWAIMFSPGEGNSASAALETRGPYGQVFAATNQRAVLRSVIAAMRSHQWRTKGVETVVIATDSDYVVDGATRGARAWLAKKTFPNEDLWRMLLGEVERQEELGTSFQLCRVLKDKIPSQLVFMSRQAASRGPHLDEWKDWRGD